MKPSLIIFSSLLFFFSGCKKDDSPTATVTPKVSATVDGAAWNAATQIIAYNTSGVLEIDALKTSNDQIGLNIKANTSGTFAMDDNTVTATYMKYNSSKGYNTVYSSRAGSGSVTITEYSATVAKGTFYFTAYYTSLSVTDSVKVINGDFVVKYTSN